MGPTFADKAQTALDRVNPPVDVRQVVFFMITMPVIIMISRSGELPSAALFKLVGAVALVGWLFGLLRGKERVSWFSQAQGLALVAAILTAAATLSWLFYRPQQSWLNELALMAFLGLYFLASAFVFGLIASRFPRRAPKPPIPRVKSLSVTRQPGLSFRLTREA